MKYLVSLLLFSAFIHVAGAQNSVSGKILDSLTHEPIPFASVYFANTSIGTLSNEKGEFIIRNFPSGKYDLTVTFVGYESSQVAIDFLNNSKSIEIMLVQSVTRLNEVVISPDTSGRASNMRQFRRSFLGETKNAATSRILNPKSIDLYFDRDANTLMAFGKKPIEIENKALGYKLIYDLKFFELNYKENVQMYMGIPRFENLVAKNKTQQKRWEKERRRAYEGSFTHFIHLLRKGDLNNEFQVYEFFRVKNRERPSNEFLQKKIAYWRDKTFVPGKPVHIDLNKNDSLSYYTGLKRKPELIDSMGREIKDVRVLLDSTRNNILYTGMLYIFYKKEREEDNYASRNWRSPLNEQRSIIHFFGPRITIYDNGYYEDIRNVFFEGYMGWAEKIAETLPLDYGLPEGDPD